MQAAFSVFNVSLSVRDTPKQFQVWCLCSVLIHPTSPQHQSARNQRFSLRCLTHHRSSAGCSVFHYVLFERQSHCSQRGIPVFSLKSRPGYSKLSTCLQHHCTPLALPLASAWPITCHSCCCYLLSPALNVTTCVMAIGHFITRQRQWMDVGKFI